MNTGIHIIEGFKSALIPGRTVGIWLPEDYSDAVPHAVLYLHDGQYLFEKTTPPGENSWKADTTTQHLIRSKVIMPTILVAIWNAGDYRHAEYMPQKPFEILGKKDQERMFDHSLRPDGTPVFNTGICSDIYLKFIVEELKPFTDHNFNTLTDRAHTFIGGASMGGMVSLYALCEYPQIFGSAVCLSTHWPGIYTNESNPIPSAIFSYLRKKLPDAGTHKLYFDHGTEELDRLYPSHQKIFDALARRKGWNDHSFLSRVFNGTGHNEKDWAARLHIPLSYILEK